jgi:hypothetical protein
VAKWKRRINISKTKIKKNLETIVNHLNEYFEVYLTGSAIKSKDYNDIDLIVRCEDCNPYDYDILLPDVKVFLLYNNLASLLKENRDIKCIHNTFEHGYGGFAEAGVYTLDVNGTKMDVIYSPKPLDPKTKIIKFKKPGKCDKNDKTKINKV